ncbi:hypothetical protein CBS147339_2301 [Penicillium roqueforti]|uniref:Probable transposable element n=1 Tax=Penicillium roqueforti (strain FM164) TaxID=1365484 RepID=W6QSD6_PENRF|nr:hypothetical protein DTO012A8_4045 [Penicillium roqueforti]KAI3082421.1 hypothetical protein CBS147339_2301 [Penicillium roqueforti]KAI3098871.1 hypothetical protein CBS147338_4035 [Penicillium roqueforti]KAI3187348.1 hypothetical protein DTO032C6_4126 [Penicillium roqueforti]CDM37024.1 Probable transposable element [Penicillium roqueforti FM164]
MANPSDEEADSRTALVGAPRTRSNPRSSRSASRDSTRPTKRRRRNRNKDSDLADFVPKGVAFSATSLPVDDPDNTSSSGSSSASDSNAAPTTVANPHAGSTAPAISWNQGRKAPVRTTLGKRSAPADENPAPVHTTLGKRPAPPDEKPTQFEAVNDKYWRSRSESLSANGEDKPTANNQPQDDGELEDGEIDSKSDTDDSDSLGSEADDSILLNIGDKMDGINDYDPATLAHQHGSNTGNSGTSTQSGPGSKEEAFRLFSIKYPNAPVALVDLSQTDLEILAKYVYFDRNIHDLDLKLPISCLECQNEGHIADVCPAKECEYCGAWNQHQSSTCPDWRRCQRCRERGHDEPQCDAKLRNFAYEVPCDYCGNEHLEAECDFLWKFPRRDLHSDQVIVSICCANCCSAKHLVGDCPSSSLRATAASSSFTLKGIDPDMITNLNTVLPQRETGPPSRSRGRDREWSRPPSPDDDDMMSRISRGGRGRPIPAPRGNTLSIRVPSRAKRGGDPPSRGPSRGRSTFSGNNNRARSPNPPLPRGPPPPRGGGRNRGSQRGGFSRGPRNGGGGGGRSRGW